MRSAKERRRQGQTDRAAWYWGRNQGQTPRRVRSDVPQESRGTWRLSSVKEEEQQQQQGPKTPLLSIFPSIQDFIWLKPKNYLTKILFAEE